MKRKIAVVLSLLVLASIGLFLIGCGDSSSINGPTKYLFVADNGNHRILVYTSPFTTNQSASTVLGQPDFTSNTSGATASKMYYPLDVAVDRDGNVYEGEDATHCRVLQFKAPLSTGMSASVVFGQPDFTSTGCATTATGLGAVIGIATDPDGNLWVADVNGHRIVKYSPPFSNGMAATTVLGQGDFTSGTANRGVAVAANGLNAPRQIKFDSSGNLWVVDHDNNRILRYPRPFSNGMAADLVIGQAGFTTNSSGVTATALSGPNGIAFDKDGNLWVGDWFNNRVLQFKTPFSNGMAATTVIGQTDFTTSSSGLSSSKFSWAPSLGFDSDNNLIVADEQNHRVLIFQPPFSNGMAATTVLGQANMTSGSENQGGTTGANTYRWPFAIATSSR